MTSDQPRPRLDPRTSWIGFLFVAGLAAAIALTTLDPSASRGLVPSWRLAFWLVHVFAALALLVAVQQALNRVRWLDRRSPWFAVGLAGLIGAVAFTPVAWALDFVFPIPLDDDDQDGMGALSGLLGEFAGLFLPMFLVWLGLNTPRLLTIEARPGAAAAQDRPPAGSPTEPAELWSRVPPRLGGDLVALSSELHYLRVYTSEGDTLILHAFSRALDGVAGIEGMQIHRSHWVAFAHIDSIRRDGQRIFCRLDSGLELPVSRPYRAQLRSRWKDHAAAQPP